MIVNENDGIRWFCDIADAKPEYSPIKINSVLSFYTLSGKRSTLTIDNLTPIENVAYTVCSKAEDRYYLHEFRNHPVENLYLYRKSLTFSGDDLAVENLNRYVFDSNVHLLLNSEQVASTTDMLKRVWRAQFGSDGQLDYRHYIQILDQVLKLEDYKSHGSSLTGYKTVVNQFDIRIKDLWKSAYDTYINKKGN